MGLKEQINEDIKSAMKAKEKERLSVLRLILSEIKYAQAAVNVHQDLPEADVQKVIASYHKRLTKSLDDFPAGDKRDQIRAEIAIVEEYLPKKVLSSTTDRTFGPLMKQVLAKLGGSGDGRLVSEILKERLGES